MIISIHTYNNHLKLRRLLLSIANCPSLSSAKIYVIDGSSDKTIQLHNHELSKKLSLQGKLEINYVNQKVWNKIRSQIINTKVFSKKFQEILMSNNLFKDSHVSDMRNITSIIALTFEGKSDMMIKLDDDMVFPKEFKLNNKKSDLIGIPIYGSPDFSRLEWLQFYRKNISFDSQKDERYTTLVTEKIGNGKSRSLIKDYSDLYIRDDERKLNSKYNLAYPSREEISGGAYAIKIKLLSLSLSPKWYEEDWYYFKIIRKHVTPSENSLNIGHIASNKNILNIDRMKSEEEGKIITHPLRRVDNLTRDVIQEYVKLRSQLIGSELIKFRELSERFRDNPFLYKQIKEIINMLSMLETYVENIDIQTLLKKHESFLLENEIWAKESIKLSGLITKQL